MPALEEKKKRRCVTKSLANTMATITQADFLAMQSRLNRNNLDPAGQRNLSTQVDRESKLQNDIIVWLKSQGWYYEWSPMCSASSLPAGSPDFRIAAPGGMTYWIECKTRTSKLRPEQAAVAHMLIHLGHKHAVVRSMEEFLNVVQPLKTS